MDTTAFNSDPFAPRMNLARTAPATYRAMLALEGEVHLDPVLKELVKLRASILNGCAFCLDMHWKDARQLGESEQRLYGVAAWEEAPYYSERERAALALTDAMTRLGDGHVPDTVYARAAECFDHEELAQLIFAVTVINAWNRLAITTRTLPGSYQPAVRQPARPQ